MKQIQFLYQNHRGEIKLRTVIPDSIEYITKPDPTYQYQGGWFLSGLDVDKNARRSFKLDRIVLREDDAFRKDATTGPIWRFAMEDSK